MDRMRLEEKRVRQEDFENRAGRAADFAEELTRMENAVALQSRLNEMRRQGFSDYDLALTRKAAEIDEAERQRLTGANPAEREEIRKQFDDRRKAEFGAMETERLRAGEKIAREIKERMETERLELMGAKEWAEILKIRLHYEQKIRDAQQSNPESDMIAAIADERDRTLLRARHELFSGATQESLDRAAADATARRGRLEAGGKGTYVDIAGRRRFRTGPIMDEAVTSGVGPEGPVKLGEDTKGGPFGDYVSAAEAEKARAARANTRADQRRRAREAAGENGTKMRDELDRIRREEGQGPKPEPIDQRVKKADEEARRAADEHAKPQAAWDQKRISELMSKLDSIDRKLPGGFGP